MQTRADGLLFRSRVGRECDSVINRVTAQDAGWDLQSMEVRRLAAGDAWSHDTAECEAALVLLGGTCSVS